MINKLWQGNLPYVRRNLKVKEYVLPAELGSRGPEMVPRLLPGNSREARQVVTQAEVHGGGHGKN